MGPLIFSLMSLLSQPTRPWNGDPAGLRSGHAMYSNPSQPAFENIIGDGIYPNNGNGIPVIIAIDSPEVKSRHSYTPNMPNIIRIPIDSLPMPLPSMRTSDFRDIPEKRGILNADLMQSLMDVIPVSSQSFRAPFGRSLSQTRNAFNPEIIPINMNDYPMYFQSESKDIPLPRMNSNPDMLKFMMAIPPSQSTEASDEKDIFQPRSISNPDILQMVLNSMPMSQKSITQESREFPPPKFSLFDMLLDVPESSSPPPSLSEQPTTTSFDTAASNNALLDFPMLNFGRSMDSLPMAVSYQVPPVLPPLVPAMNITAMTMCENSMIILSCPIGQSIHLISVFYGRTSKEICNSIGPGVDYKNYDTTTCNLSSAMNTMVNLCEGQNTCKMTAINTVFGEDPCPGIAKYMQISYYCR